MEAVLSRGCAPLQPTPAPPQEATPCVPSRLVVGAIESAVVCAQMREQLPTTSSSDEATSTTSDAPVTHVANAKKRKPTYYMRKDEMAALHDEIAALQARLAELEMRPRGGFSHALEYNAALRCGVQQGDLAVATAQSLLASYGTRRPSPPLGGFIHLPKDATERARKLSALKRDRLHEAVAYALARTTFVNVAKTSRQVDTFETDTGDFVATHWEITPLSEARSVQDAYRELLYFVETQEMTMSEKLGVLTIRESESEPVDGAQVVRMLSSHDNGVQVESNLAVLSECYQSSELLAQPHALMVVDYVDQDDLFPYQPQSRIRKDVVSVTMITEVPGTRANDRPLVTLIRWAYVRVNNDPSADRHAVEHIAREGVGKWCDMMLKFVRDRLVWQS